MIAICYCLVSDTELRVIVPAPGRPLGEVGFLVVQDRRRLIRCARGYSYAC